MFVKIEMLKAVTKAIFSHLEKLEINGMDVDKDFYWEISSNQKYDPYGQPSDFTLGQLSEDIQEILAIHSGNNSPSGHALVALGTLLRFMGERYPM